MFRKCDGCAATLRAEEFTSNLEVCPECGHHYRLSAEAWLDLLVDPGSLVEQEDGLRPQDSLGFVDSKPYSERIEISRRKAGVDDAILVGDAAIQGRPIQLGLFLFRFMGGSMGSVVGERITRLFERGTERREPVVLMSCSGGARMQEGALSLMQMAKSVAAL
ncbi:MAG: acetyl-CoA carboxylase carboxyl transferase subunit beta, partial [Myxococcales bacterium]|nr:acetyl-CoA carboxylase carboxyl transferase subunit beta [Myxococcales bacterium]